jgi:hypothetical protein
MLGSAGQAGSGFGSGWGVFLNFSLMLGLRMERKSWSSEVYARNAMLHNADSPGMFQSGNYVVR